jgi:cytochrome c oxidase subunit 2
MGLLLAILIWLMTIITVVWFAITNWTFPSAASEHSAAIDSQFTLTWIVVAVAFFLSQMALGYFVWRYRSTGDRNERATYTHGNARVEMFFTVLTAIVFVTVAFLGQRVWISLHLNAAAADAVHIEVVGQQFLWNFRYPGADGKFGRSKPELYNDEDNSPMARPGPLGLDPADPAGKDDMVSVGLLVVPVNRAVNLTLYSKDVTHSLFIPNMRFKQDAVPGLKVDLHFKPIKEGRYEIACAELCGLGHHTMGAFLEVKSQAEYDKWLAEKTKQ